MWPLVRPGDLVTLGRIDSEELKLGDVVAVQGMPDGGLMLHRLVRLREGRLLIRGDNTSVDNGEFEAEAVWAIASRVARAGRAVWFGAGRAGRVVAWLVRHGCVARANRLIRGAQRISHSSSREGSGAA
jgi:hypothetical protein